MSRHEFTEDFIDAAVGWDPPLNTFFAVVKDTAKGEDDQIQLWIGCTPREIHDPKVVVDAIRPWVKVPDGLFADLYREAHT